jgi:hypothetical protein
MQEGGIMSGSPKPWHDLVLAGLQPALEGVLKHYATPAGNPRAAQVASAYIEALRTLGASLPQWEPQPHVVDQLVQTAWSVGTLYQQRNFRGVLQQSFMVLSALPGDPSAKPPTIPPPPGSDD